jgi:Zn-finger nucleic acid-binding protein
VTTAGPYREAWKPRGPTCPRCAAKTTILRRVRVGENSVHRCDACGGVWVTARDFNQILVDVDRQNQILSDRQLAGPTRPIASPIDCPVCGEALNRSNFGRKSGVLVDSCRRHGIWFDAGELRRVVAYLRAQARRYELDLSPTDLETEADEMEARIAAVLAESRPQKEVPLWKTVLDALIETLIGH